jgi:hypothetical protein
MPQTIILKIDVSKINKDWLFKGQRGTYLDLALYENDQPDEYGNTHAIKQNPPKVQREAGEKGHYVGNGKALEPRQKPQQRPQERQRPAPQTGPSYSDDMPEDDIPF